MFDAASLPAAAVRGALLAGVTLMWIVAIVRLLGVRALSKMTAFDFVITLASGSLLANAGTADEPAAFVQALAALTALLCLQYALAWGRGRSARVRRLVDNRPIAVMRDGRIDEDELRRSRLSRGDVLSKLRQAGVADPSAVALVVVEATGDVSVVTGDGVDAALLDAVRDARGTDAADPR